MVHVQLAKDWTDGTGAEHSAGDTVEVDAVTLAELEATGVVDGKGPTLRSEGWPGPTVSPPDTAPDSWAGPTAPPADTAPDSWAGPTAPPKG